jgi:hypothetical protein
MDDTDNIDAGEAAPLSTEEAAEFKSLTVEMGDTKNRVPGGYWDSEEKQSRWRDLSSREEAAKNTAPAVAGDPEETAEATGLADSANLDIAYLRADQIEKSISKDDLAEIETGFRKLPTNVQRKTLGMMGEPHRRRAIYNSLPAAERQALTSFLNGLSHSQRRAISSACGVGTEGI